MWMKNLQSIFACLAAALVALGNFRSMAVAQAPYRATTTLATRYAAAHGRMALLGGNASAGLEGWAYPVQIFRGLTTSFVVGEKEWQGLPLLAEIEYTPTSIVRIYRGAGFWVKETLFVPSELPGAVLSYQVEAAQRVRIRLRFTPVLDLMWPVGMGGQEVQWLAAEKAYSLHEPTGHFAALLGSPDTVAHDDLLNTDVPLSADHVLTLTMEPGADHAARLYFAGETHGVQSARAIYGRLISTQETLQAAAQSHFAELLSRRLTIETPDPEVNKALAWSQVALDQAWVCNPTLGCGLVAGYGPSRGIARRPQYDWFFAGDALTAMHALLLTGQFERTRDALTFLFRYQDAKTGMMWHEISQSASYVRWAQDYPYMFPHVDITFDFLAGLDEYLRASGDKAFLQEHWQTIAAAYGYCASLIDVADGLPRVPEGKEGRDEQQHPREELQLAVEWVEAAKAFSHLAAKLGHSEFAAPAQAASDRAAAAVPGHFWSLQQAFFVSEIKANGEPEDAMHLPPEAALRLLNPSQRTQVMQRIAGPQFQTAWGTRGVGSASRNFDPDSYATGSVWATATSTAAMELWQNGNSREAWATWRNLLPWLSLDAMGHLHETLSGAAFRPQTESVPEQTWSSAGLISSFIEGLAGLRLDADTQTITLTPHLPAEWDHLDLRHLRVGDSEADLTIRRVAGGMQIDVQGHGPVVSVVFTPETRQAVPGCTATLGGKPMQTIEGTTCSYRLQTGSSGQILEVRFGH